MKRQLAICATAAAMAAPSAVLAASHEDGPQLYGRVHGAVSAADYDDRNNAPNDGEVTFTTNSSAIGVEGTEGLDNGLTALYQWEAGVYWSQDSGSNLTNQQRDSYVGLKGDFGKVLAGRLPYGNQFAHETNAFTHQMGTSAGYLMHEAVGSRVDNVLWYSSPEVQGVEINATYLPAGNNPYRDNNGNPRDENAFGGQLRYNNDLVTLSGTFFQDKLTPAGEEPLMSLSGKLDYGMGDLGAQYTQLDDSTAYNLTATYGLPSGKVKAQLTGTSDYGEHSGATAVEDPTMMVLGYDHQLADRTIGYVIAAMGQDGASITDNGFDTATGTGNSKYVDASAPTTSDQDSQGLSVGLKHSF